MRFGAKTFGCLVGCVLLASAGRVCAIGETENPYHAIVDRNVFDLKAPPPPITNPPTAPPLPPANVKLTGMSTILGKPFALFKVQEPNQPGKPPNKEEDYMLRAGERKGTLELMEINYAEKKVKISLDGAVSTIGFAKIDLPSGPGAPSGVPYGIPGAPGAPPPLAQPAGGRVPSFIPPPQQPATTYN